MAVALAPAIYAQIREYLAPCDALMAIINDDVSELDRVMKQHGINPNTTLISWPIDDHRTGKSTLAGMCIMLAPFALQQSTLECFKVCRPSRISSRVSIC